MGNKVEIIEKIEELASKGKIKKEIAQEIGISLSYTTHIVNSEGINVKTKSERTLDRIRELAAQNKTRTEIAQELGITQIYVTDLSREEKIPINNKLKKDIEKLRPYVETMHVSVSDASRLLGRKQDTAKYVLKAIDGMNVPQRLRYWVRKEVESVRNAKEGEPKNNAREISNLLQRSEYSLGRLYPDFNKVDGINSTPLTPQEINGLRSRLNESQISELDYILEFNSITDMGIRFGYSRQAAQQKIHRWGLYSNWIIGREEIKQRDKQRKNLIEILKYKMEN